MSTEIKNIKLDNIIPSTTNPRKSFEKQGLLELANSIKENGVLPLGHAVLLSKIDKETQEKVIKTTNLFSEKVILGGANQIYCSKTLTQLKESIAGTMLSFQRINFDLDNENLIPKAGSCQACPKRTINQNLLFSDITASDLCTDSICYNMKIQAQLNIDIEKSKADFGDVLLAEKERWSSNALRIKGAAKSVYFQTEKTDDFCVPVVINKTDNYDQVNLGITVFIKDQTKEVLEEAENRSQSNNWELQQNQKTDEVIIPRFQRVFNTLGSRLIPEFSNAFFIDNLMRIEFKNLVILSNLLDEKLCENTGEAIRLLANSMNYSDRDDLRKIICTSLSKNLPQQTLINILVLEDIVEHDFEDETDVIVSIRKYFEIIGLSENPENNLEVVDMEEVSTKPQTT